MPYTKKGKISRREPEPELMDDPEQVRAYAETDFSATDQALAEKIRSRSTGAAPKKILDLGCGPGNISFLIAAAYPDAMVLGIDGAANMIQQANKCLQTTYAHLHNLRFEVINLPSEHFYGDQFDMIISNSLLHHLHDSSVLWREIKKTAAENCFFYIADLIRPDTYEQAKSLMETYVSDAPAILQHDFYRSLLAAYSKAEIAEQMHQAGLHDLTIELPTDRHIHCYGRM